MAEDWRSKVLERWDHRNGDNSVLGEPLGYDKWIASSALQKCVRRGDAQLALRAAVTFAALDSVGLWRRLISIACEDIGAADAGTMIETVAVATSPQWRAEHNEMRVLASVIRRLTEAPKDRSADLAMLTVRHYDGLEPRRKICRRATLGRRLQLLTDPHTSLLDRAVAAWFSSGLDFRYERLVGPGNLDRLGYAYRALGVASELSAAAITTGRRTREPFTIVVSLVWLEIQRSGGGVVREADIPESPEIDGLLLCSVDEHTRTGKQAIARLVAEEPDLRNCLSRYVPKSRWTTAAQHAAFYVDGASVARRLDWSQSHSLEKLGIEADLGSAKVPPEGVRPLLDSMRSCLPRLNELRCETLRGLPATKLQSEFEFGAH